MRSYFTMVALHLLLLLIFDGSLPSILPSLSTAAFPVTVTSISAGIVSESNNTSNFTKNHNQYFTTTDTPSISQTGDLTEYPVFISATEETQTEAEVVTESYMIIEDQEVDDDDDSDSSTISSVILQSTSPMPSPKSSPEQEEVLRELKKLWDISEGMSDSGNDALKNSLSSIVHLAYARIYIEPDETLMKLKYLLQQLQERILLGTNTNSNESIATTENVLSLIPSNNGNVKIRKKRSFYDGFDDVEAIFFANVNSEENSVLPNEKHYTQKIQQPAQDQRVLVTKNLTLYDSIPVSIKIKSNDTLKFSDNLDRTLLTTGTISSTLSTLMSVSSTTPSTIVKKVVHINDRQKPMPSFYLTPERIKELKSRVTSTMKTSTSTLSPISIVIDDELENEVNLLQQQQQVDNYDIHISSTETLIPLTTATPSSSTSFHKKPLSGSTIVMRPTTELPYKPEDIALALFQLLRPSAFEDDESEDQGVTSQPHPSPSNILYQVGSLSSFLNFTVKTKNVSSTAPTTTAAPVKIATATTNLPFSSSTTMASPTKLDASLSILKLKDKYVKNKINITAPLFVPAPPVLSDLGLINNTLTSTNILSPSTSTERQKPVQNNDAYDYTDVVDQTPASSDDPSMTHQ